MRTPIRTFTALALTFALVAPGIAEAGKKKKKKKGDDTPTEAGWFQGEDWMGACYYPPTWDGMASGAKRMKWQEARNAVISQWKGQRDDGISFDEGAIESAETAMLAEPDRIETVAAENYEKCKAAMTGKGGSEWGSWVMSLNANLTKGECPTPKMSYKLYDYLSINDDWQIPVQVCKGDRVIVHATDGDYFRLSDDGEWLNAAGDSSEPGSGNLPCTLEGCYRGALIMKFTGIDGMEMVMPVGLDTTYTAPNHGRLEVMINDDSLSDNKWKIEGGLEHHTGIEYRPAE